MYQLYYISARLLFIPIYRQIYLILCSCAPVRETRRVCDALLQTMGAERTKCHTCSPVDTANRPESHDE